MIAEIKPSSGTPAATQQKLPRGLFWRGDTVWVSKKVNGQRHQFSTGCKTAEEGLEVYRDFLREHQAEDRSKPKAGAGRRISAKGKDLPKGLYWKGNVIWLSRTVNGEHFNISTGTATPTLAKKFLDEFNLKAFKGEKLGVFTRPKVNFEQLATRYLGQAQTNGCRAKTLARYRAVCDHFARYLQQQGIAETAVSRIQPSDMEGFKSWRCASPLKRNGKPYQEGEEPRKGTAAKTLRFEVQVLGSVFKFAVKMGYSDDNPAPQAGKIKLRKQPPVFLEADEIRRFLEAARTIDEWGRGRYKFGTQLHDIFLAYLKSGMRLEELRHLEWSDVDMKAGVLHVRHQKTMNVVRTGNLASNAIDALKKMSASEFDGLNAKEKGKILGFQAATKAELEALSFNDLDLSDGRVHLRGQVAWNPKTTGRSIPIAESLREVLRQQTSRVGLVFPDLRDRGLWRFKVNRFVKACATKAKIEKSVHTHTLRHTFATQLRQQGVPIETIKELLGHADLRETLIYAHFSPDEARSAIVKLDFI